MSGIYTNLDCVECREFESEFCDICDREQDDEHTHCCDKCYLIYQKKNDNLNKNIIEDEGQKNIIKD